jgi:5'-nucleotidase
VVKEVFDGRRFQGFAVEGSPADCVKIGVAEFCPERPGLVVSGINGGLNAGINVLYSGTVAAAIEGAFFDITSVAVSLEYDEHARFDRAAEMAVDVIEQILEKKGQQPRLYNMNIPTAALEGATEVRVVRMCVVRWGEDFEARTDPRGRSYYWATGGPPAPPDDVETDLSALARGCVTVTPLEFDMTRRDELAVMQEWDLAVPGLSRTASANR